jgi:Lar family restriction alleviation protein
MPGALSPCPFCGGGAAGIDTFNNAGGKPVKFRARCPECMAATGWHGNGEEAAEKWNTRAREEGKPPEGRVINRDLFFSRGGFYARNPVTGYCYADTGDGWKRVKRGLWLAAYEECAGASGKGKPVAGPPRHRCY